MYGQTRVQLTKARAVRSSTTTFVKNGERRSYRKYGTTSLGTGNVPQKKWPARLLDLAHIHNQSCMMSSKVKLEIRNIGIIFLISVEENILQNYIAVKTIRDQY